MESLPWFLFSCSLPWGFSVTDSSWESSFLWGCTVRHGDTVRRGDQELVAEDPNRSHLRVDPLPFGGTEGCPVTLPEKESKSP